jgi:16S rRNA (adenine1518-N6/adenine1519-N6)-dimethyltransferase
VSDLPDLPGRPAAPDAAAPRAGSPDASAPDGAAPRAGAATAAAKRAPRLDPLAVRRQLRDEGLRARHSMSQNFLADPDVLESILDLAAPEAGRRILEVGPGLGILTGGLLAGGASVTAVELDSRLAGRLGRVQTEAVESGALRLVQGDILDQKIAALMTTPFDVVANVPYHITSPILRLFLGAAPRPSRLVLMVQREVAERIAAEPGDMSYISVFVQFHAAVRVAFVVPREAFEPAPDVESAVVEIVPLDPLGERPRLSAEEEEELWRLVHVGFHERRKMLRNVLVRGLIVPSEQVDAALATCGIASERRPQTLSVDDWLALRVALAPLPAAKIRGGVGAQPGAQTGRGAGKGKGNAGGHSGKAARGPAAGRNGDRRPRR